MQAKLKLLQGYELKQCSKVDIIFEKIFFQNFLKILQYDFPPNYISFIKNYIPAF